MIRCFPTHRLTCAFRGVVMGSLLATVALAVPSTPHGGPTDVAPVSPAAPIDRAVASRLERAGVTPALCADGVFVRRVHLDVIGTLPTAQEARDFIQDPDTANKRRQLIDRLLARPEYADYWAMKWSDILRIKAEFPVNLWPNAAQAYHRWVRAAIAANQPYDAFVRDLLTASGSNFRVGPANFYRAIQNRQPDGIAASVALTFMGTRTETWPASRLDGMAAFFSQIGYKPTSEWKEEHVFWDPLGVASSPANLAPGRAAITAIGQPPAVPAPGTPPAVVRPRPTVGVFPDGTPVTLPAERDPRDLFADWLITPENPWFTRAIANRTWFWLLGRGVIHEPDDIRPDNPPADPGVLAALESALIGLRYDLRAFHRLILNSRTYQLTALTEKETDRTAPLIGYRLRRLDAEVLIDAINAITGSSDLYTSPIPEPFTYIPEGQPAIAIADGSITSPFLALFGRSARATGQACERDHKPIPAQWLHLLNSSHIQRKLEQGPKLKALFDSGRSPPRLIEELYLTILSRLPTPAEMKIAEAYGQIQPVRQVAAKPGGPAPAAAVKTVVVKRREDWVDLAWSLINSTEFLYHH
ncbi:DUF1553 domain-containing protein [Horticoccus sp. 23ND18S-11]|uniref:DUF1553 domain-containing protein n=1 Tax=Horticoccus sp. 23ND18S-11 TaxID=3391832 RepID=UPI0039C95A1F